jgi:hypothetical protein
VILPTKGISPDQALLTVGASILKLLDQPKTVSRLWDEVRKRAGGGAVAIRFDWFMLALDVLYTLGTIDMTQGRVRRSKPTDQESAS